MEVFKIEGAISEKYKGSGYALASVVNGKITNLIYLQDIFPDYEFDSISQGELESLIDNPNIGPSVRVLQATGEVFMGMCSCMEFVVL